MTSAISDNELRRNKLLTQLAAILQTDAEPSEAAAPSEPTVPDESALELQAMGLPVETSTTPTVRDGWIAPDYRSAGSSAAQAPVGRADNFVPIAPTEFAKLRLAEVEIESLILKFLLHQNLATGREITAQIGILFGICERLLHALKTDRLVVLKGAAGLNDYVYELTEAGAQRARKFADLCQYFGAAPVCLEDYAASVAAQSLQNGLPQIDDLRRAFADLTLGPETFERLGRAMLSGKGLFLYGPPGNGKTSIARRVTAAYGETIWIPQAISAWGEIIRVFDPSCHEEMPLPEGLGAIDEEKIDRRWIRIRRPTIVVGGELVLDNLEITANQATGTAEAPLQLKSNCGTLVIDDFGRQQVAPATLLNRWIVPLEKRYDFLNLSSGRKIRVPFDQFVVFSTNLQPRELVDEAFLRRIPYKIDVCGPTEEQFRALFVQLTAAMEITPNRAAIDYLIDKYYRQTDREMRFCQPRDLLRQVKVYYDCLQQPARLTVEAIDAAATDYFSVL